jgi:DNA-directed RNA polymerase subunit RPC12/RpoP
MAAWGLNCANCDQNLTKFAIEDTLESYFFPEKPDFPERGTEIECPNCGYKATYQRTDLAYMTR